MGKCVRRRTYHKKEIETSFGETLSWEYLSYVRGNSVYWDVPTEILYGKKDNMTSFSTITDFSKKNKYKYNNYERRRTLVSHKGANVFLDNWIRSNI